MKKIIVRSTSVIAAAVLLLCMTCAAFAANETLITFSDSGAAVSGSGSGVSVDGTDVRITKSGTYTFTGSCSDGSITVKKNVTGGTLILDGLDLSASATAPVTCNKGTEVTVFAAEGSVNFLADDKFNNDDIYTDETLYPDVENAVIKCKDGSNVTICGTGTINVTSYGKNGVKGGYDLYEEDEDGNATDVLLSEASLTIRDVTLNITANVNDGLKADKELNILSGRITVSAADDAIKSDYTLNIGEQGAEGPTINVTKAAEGIEAATVNVYSGDITVNASDDGINAANSDLSGYAFSYAQYGGRVYVNVTNGDGMDSNGTVVLNGGTLEVYSPSQGDGDPIDSDRGTTFGGATVLAVGNNAMAQSFSGTYVSFGGSGGGGRGGFGGMGGSSSAVVAAGKDVTVKDSSGRTLYSGSAVRNAGYVIFASPSLVSGQSYTLVSGGSAVSTAAAGSGQGGQGGGNGFPGGGVPLGPSSGVANTCPYCGGEHSGFFGGLISFIHRIMYVFETLRAG